MFKNQKDWALPKRMERAFAIKARACKIRD